VEQPAIIVVQRTARVAGGVEHCEAAGANARGAQAVSSPTAVKIKERGTIPRMREVVDYRGRLIRLTDERREHILQHPEMSDLESTIEQVLSAPEVVRQSSSDPNVELFYRLLRETAVGEKWLCAVVKYTGNDAFLLTAYLTDQLKSGVQLWPRT
jgi:hypothetical protein